LEQVGGTVDVNFNITPFTGTNSNIRVSICQFVPDANTGDTWGRIIMTVHTVDAATTFARSGFSTAALPMLPWMEVYI